MVRRGWPWPGCGAADLAPDGRHPALEQPSGRASGASDGVAAAPYPGHLGAGAQAVRGFGEALFLDANQNVVECTGENVFLVKDGRVTAVAHDDALPGITRETVIELTGAQVRPVTLAELHDADEVFLTGTSAEVAAIEALDDTVYGDNPVTRELQSLYARLVRGEVSGYEHWLTRF
ncbi:MAG: hypothetical protein CVV14_15205 [Gammaproteobacteria bacterium HGW-Gammaproteobacteria-4]|nr:MAG: hypothetical protein CVV14_15205 [Gammaproteobacteria bacterium HGW-Gammaproteobacteria-4]